MAAAEATTERQFLKMAEEVQRVAHELLEGTELDALLAEVQPAQREASLTAVIHRIEQMKMDPAKHAAVFDLIRSDQVKARKLATAAAEIRVGKMDKALLEEGKVATSVGKVLLEKIVQKMDKAPVKTGKVATSVGNIRKEKMDKAPVKAGKVATSVDKAPVEIGMVATVMDTILTEKCAESDLPAVVNGKHRLSDDYVRFILAMPRENPDEVIPYYDRCSTLAEVMGEEWLEEQKRVYEEGAARTRRIHDEFVQFQTWVLKEWLEKGYVEVDQEYINNANELDEYSRELWEQLIEKRDPLVKFADRDDPVYADFYVPYDPVEQARVLLAEEFSSLIESN